MLVCGLLDFYICFKTINSSVTKIVLSYSLGLYQWSDKVIRRATRLWDIRGGHMVRHEVHLMVTPRVVVSVFKLVLFTVHGKLRSRTVSYTLLGRSSEAFQLPYSGGHGARKSGGHGDRAESLGKTLIRGKVRKTNVL